jgi:hypothetical protein
MGASYDISHCGIPKIESNIEDPSLSAFHLSKQHLKIQNLSQQCQYTASTDIDYSACWAVATKWVCSQEVCDFCQGLMGVNVGVH